MWIFTKLGFFSATLAEAEDDSGRFPKLWGGQRQMIEFFNGPTLKIRARLREDLERLLDFMKQEMRDSAITAYIDPKYPHTFIKIQEDAKADYRFRVFMPRDIWEKVVSALVKGIDYGNFKGATHGDPERDRAYMGVWGAMHALQEKRHPRPRRVEFFGDADFFDPFREGEPIIPDEPEVKAAKRGRGRGGKGKS
jgi:hypothetical protein